MTQPLVSVIIPVYNVEEYVADTIESVISQSMNFSKNIEIILIDDGSTDGSSEIAESYAKKFNNVVYKKIINGGVSRARNVGFSISRGKYIHFLDSDDIISKDFYTRSVRLLERNSQSIDFVASKIKFFDAIIDSHPLNYKFYKTQVIDLYSQPDNPILHAVTCVYRRSAIEGIFFDESLTISEDLKFLGEVLKAKKKYGVLKESTYYYRKRVGGQSAISGKEYDEKYYLSTPKRVYEYLLQIWNKEQGYRGAIENTVLYDVSYRLSQKSQSVLMPDAEKQYKDLLLSIAARCQDSVIVNHRFLTIHQKLYILKNKYRDSFTEKLKIEKGVLYFSSMKIYSYTGSVVYLDFLKQQSDSYIIEGYINDPIVEGVSVRLDISEGQKDVEFVERYQRQESFLGDIYYNGGAFKVELNLPISSTLSFSISTPENKYSIYIKTLQFTQLNSLQFGYRKDNARLLGRYAKKIKSSQYSLTRHLYYEFKVWLAVLMNWRIGTAFKQFQKLRNRNLKQLSIKAKLFEIVKPLLFVVEGVAMIPQAIILRTWFYIDNTRKERPIWIISDRGMAAGDNGEALFRYIMNRSDCPADVYFAISKESEDYTRLSKLGPVLDYGSVQYKRKFLLADKVISSHADIEVTNPFLRQIDHYVDLFRFDFIFLQHGIIRNDLSGWLNRFDKNISLFIVSAKKEYDSIFQNPYYYHQDQVLLSGLPRYDYLEDDRQNKVIIAPTYRNNLLRLRTDKYGARPYDVRFKESEYFNFYNNLINDEKLLSVMKSKNMTGELYLHPNFAAQLQDFEGNDIFSIMHYPYNYRSAISEGAVLISDYSSVLLDFAYLKKPVIYAQFDAENFFKAQPYTKGDFFDDESDGFGPVTHDYAELKEEYINLIKTYPHMSDMYKKRVERFFKYHDKNNSERVYKMLL